MACVPRCSRWCDCTLEDRFWSRVQRRANDECWPWTAQSTSFGGYGKFGLRKKDLPGEVPGRIVDAHRLAFRLIYGRWPEPCALHGCDNPPCCNAENPEHIHEGTLSQNSLEMHQRGRHGRDASLVSGSRHPRALFTEAQVAEIRLAHASGVRVADLARSFGVLYSTMHHVATGKGYRGD